MQGNFYNDAVLTHRQFVARGYEHDTKSLLKKARFIIMKYQIKILDFILIIIFKND